jgi:spore coat polysaccharide biosynthesis protein SpsF
MNNNLSFIIQARVNSSRLPSKILLPFFNDKTVFDLLIEKLQDNFPTIPIIIATSTDKTNDVLQTIALEKKVMIFKGDENDVLSRFIEAADKFNIENAIRICSDNPFLDVEELQKLIDFVQANNYDYVSFCIDGIPSIKTHFGFWAEYVSIEALKKVNAITQSSFYHEHVTNYIYENSEFFTIRFLQPDSSITGIKDVRMTLDTQNDFKILSEIYSILSMKYDHFGINEIISFLNDNPYYKIEMKTQIKNNSK